MEILIDYLTFSDVSHDYFYWMERLNLRGIRFEVGNARYGWSEHQYYNGIHIYLGNREGVCIELSGVGCRTLESINDLKFDWIELLRELTYDGIHVSRIDIAGDDRDKILNLDKLYKNTKQRKYICRAKRKIWIDGDEQAIYFGAKTSDTRLRIYNKALERGVDEHWIRVEFQLRDDAALSFILNLIKVNDIGHTYSGVLLNYLRYTVKAPDPNNNNVRIDTVPWWDKFLGTAKRIKNIRVGGLEYNYLSLYEFVKKQCASSIKALIELNGGSIEPLMQMVMDARYNEKQRILISRCSE